MNRALSFPPRESMNYMMGEEFLGSPDWVVDPGGRSRTSVSVLRLLRTNYTPIEKVSHFFVLLSLEEKEEGASSGGSWSWARRSLDLL